MIDHEGWELVAAIDQGTTTTRCILFDGKGRMVALARRAHHNHHPRPGWVEQDALELWSATQQVVEEVFSQVATERVQGLGVTNQRETTVLWDRRTGKPVHPAIVWQDNRTVDVLTELGAEFDPAELARRTGLPLSTYFSLSKVRWLLDHLPGARADLEAGHLLFGTIDTWLVWNLTGGVDGGVHLTDPTNASRTQMMDIDSLQWDDELLALAGLPRSAMPEIRPSVLNGPAVVDPLEGVRISAVIGDQQAALFGQTVVDVGDAKCTFGTGSFLLLNTGDTPVRSTHGLMSTVAAKVEDQPPVYALEGGFAMAGGLVEWVRQTLGVIRTPPEIETIAATVPGSDGCYFVPAFSGLLSPHWDAKAQGLLVGLTSHTSRGHLARAVLESTAWQTKDALDAMLADVAEPPTSLIVDGGMTSNNLLMQSLADVLQIPVVRSKMSETVALGAAYAAGIGAGLWPDRATLRTNWEPAGEWRPQLDVAERDRGHERWRAAITLSREWGRLTR